MKLKPFNNLVGKIRSIEPIHFMLLLIATCVIVFSFFRFGLSSKQEIEVLYQDSPQSLEIKKKKDNRELLQLGEGDPNTKLSARVLEANGIANGLLQYSLHRYFVLGKGVPANTSQLLNEFQSSELKPPFVLRFTATGELVTSRGAYFIQYSAKPLMIVILSSGVDYKNDGAAFVLRTPDNSAQNYSQKNNIKSAMLATLYVAPENQGDIPLPFAIASEYQKLGWTVEPLRLTDISVDKLTAVNRMLAEVK